MLSDVLHSHEGTQGGAGSANEARAISHNVGTWGLLWEHGDVPRDHASRKSRVHAEGLRDNPILAHIPLFF